MIRKVFIYISFALTGFAVNAQVYQGPQIDTTRLLLDISGNYVSFTQYDSHATAMANMTWGNGFGANNMSFITALRASVTLPVTLSSITAKKEGEVVSIKWSTSSESNSSHFIVLKSINGKDFHQIGRIEASDNSNTRVDYAFKDIEPVNGVNYYKLKMVDMDGEYKESFVLTVSFDLDKADIIILANSEKGLIKFDIYSPRSEKAKLSLLDINGKRVLEESLFLKKGFNSYEFNIQIAPQLLIAVVLSDFEKTTKKFFY